MTNKICKLHRLERREVFMKIIDEMKKAGWQQLNAAKPSKDKIYVMYSSGNDGTKYNYIELRPFDTNASSESLASNTDYSFYDIRTPDKYPADPSFRLINGYDEVKGIGKGSTVVFPLAFHQGKSNGSSSVNHLTYPRLMIDLYLYVDKDTVIYCVYENDDNYPERKKKTVIGFFGLPSECYQQEIFSQLYGSSPFSVLVSAGSNWSGNNALTTDRSRFNFYGNGTNAIVNTFFWEKAFLKAPTSEGNIIFTPLYMGDSTDGLRAKFDGFYIYRGANYVVGDIVEISQGEEVQKYKVFNTSYSSVWGSFSDTQIALRIE
ncbi:hypothetical protein ABEW59_28845 [Bacillus wiedmannii]|uniref:Uncharacterized protein n=1 Tax=Bacillus thuringiensis TaxID=1428 RepID=A0A4R4BEN1_BACTU|nr:hypothetical protein [Bacillus thuringiensis]TCW55350.1 hypothetical protein EC917_106205 [Bacillus thuringiensis]TCW55437.1 hypothetical protein EC910_10648 [Bacillus thuringiensis]